MTPLARRLWSVVVILWPACWAGYRLGSIAAVVAAGVGGAALVVFGRTATIAVAVAMLGTVAGLGAHAGDARAVASLGDAPVPVRIVVVAETDEQPARFGVRLGARPIAIEERGAFRPWRGPVLGIWYDEPIGVVRGDRLIVRGTVRPVPGRLGRVSIAGRITNPSIERVETASAPLVGFANGLRDRALRHLDRADPGQALLAGFLVGDTSGVSDADLEALRRAGLTHFVAVSGSNVATFLALWWLVLAPVARNPRVRAAAGIVGVVVFVLVTRAEPSVVRAGVMAGVLLVGRIFGWAFDRYTALAIAVLGCLALAPRLAADVGFQLSVAATLGVMVGAGLIVFEPRAVAGVVGASLAAQVAVAPILLIVFGSLPALAPLANLVAAPLVAASTMVGGIGALTGVGPLVTVGAWPADAVLWVGRLAAPWPQLGPVGVVVLAGAGVVAWRLPVVRAPLALVGAVLVAVAIAPFGARVEPGSVVFLDVGQGDASLIVGDDATILVDGGPDPARLAQKLSEYGIDRIDLLIVSHVHADHIEGLEAVVGRMPVGVVWLAFESQSTPASEWLLEALTTNSIPYGTPPVGTVTALGGVRLEVLGPLRRYASPNDQSLVVEATVSGRRVLFSGDVEVIAQNELTGVTTDVLKVPHQGAATSDAAWLEAVSAELAVISVGPNDFGHPADWVTEVLERSGARVLRTDLDGDVVVGPSGLSSARPWWRLWP